MTTPDTIWAITEITHPSSTGYRDEHCEKCLALASEAITDARVSGSTGATATVITANGEVHTCAVTRSIGVIVRQGKDGKDFDPIERVRQVAELEAVMEDELTRDLHNHGI